MRLQTASANYALPTPNQTTRLLASMPATVLLSILLLAIAMLSGCAGAWNGTLPVLKTVPASLTAVAGQPVTFNVVATGVGPFTYQWVRDAAAIPGATAASYTLQNPTAADNGVPFMVIVTNLTGSVETPWATLSVDLPPSLTSAPGNQTVTAGQTASFALTASGTAPLTYQWFRNHVAIPGATAATFTSQPMTAADSGAAITATVTNPWGTIATPAAMVTVNSPPSIVAQPVAQTVALNQVASFTVGVSGTQPMTYQWFRSGVTIYGANAASYTTPALQAADNGAMYSVTATNMAGSVTSAAAAVTVSAPPTFSVMPVSQTVTAPAPATFSAVVNGTGPFTYQWTRNGAAIAGASAASYTTGATSSTDTGSTFAVTVTSPAGTATSLPATLTISVAPTIAAQPQAVTVNAGQLATFSVVASGTGPLTYQWLRNGSPMAGATGASYSFTTVANDTGTSFAATVSNVAGSVTSSIATVTVNSAPSITAQPVSTSVASGASASFFVLADGTGPLSYQWSRSGIAIPGATASTYVTPVAATSDSGATFAVTVSNSISSVASSAATLTVKNVPVITAQPMAVTVGVGQPATFSVAVSGTGPYTYQWYRGGGVIAGATAASYTLASAVATDNGSLFTVAVSNATGTANSAPATLTVGLPPTILTQPQSQSVNVGTAGLFQVIVAQSNGPITYQWFKNGAVLPGATTNTYTTAPLTSSDNNAVFTVAVSNAMGTTNSLPATLTVAVAPTITAQPSSETVNVGQPAIFEVTATGSGTLAYQWFKNGMYLPGATARVYTTPAVTATDNNASFSVIVADTAGSANSLAVVLTVVTAPTLAAAPQSETVAAGQPATFAVTANGTAPFVYQWFRNGKVILGATANAYTLASASTSDNDAAFTVIVADAAGSVTSPAAVLTVTGGPVITQQPASQNVCTAANVTLSAAASDAFAYQWSLNGSALAGATSSSYFIPSANPSLDAGSYTIAITNAVGSVISQPAVLNVGSTISSNPASLTASATQTATFTVAATGKAPFTYQWYAVSNGGPATIAGATNALYTTPALTTAASGTRYYAVVSDSCGTNLTSTQATLTVNNHAVPPTIVTQPQGMTVAAGSTSTLSVTATGTPNLTYQWYSIPAGSTAATAINGANAATYTLPASATNQGNDQDQYYVIVSNGQGQATSQKATLAVGAGILITGNNQPTDQYANNGATATFAVTASSTAPLTYQWYSAPAGSSSFSPIAGATGSRYTIPAADNTMNASAFYVVVSNGDATSNVISNTAGLFVGALNTVGDLCQTAWLSAGSAVQQTSVVSSGMTCSYMLTDGVEDQLGEIVWPDLLSTANLQLSFTITTDEASSQPGDGFAIMLGDATLGATASSIGSAGSGLGAQGVPGLVLGFNTAQSGAASVPTIGVTRGESSLWASPWLNTNTSIPALVAANQVVSHDYVLTVVNGQLNVTMDGSQVFSGAVTVPPVAYLYMTSATDSQYERTVVSNVSAVVSTPAK